MLKVGIIGGTGIVAGELLRLLVHHNKVDIDFVYSRSSAGLPIADFHRDLEGIIDLEFTDQIKESSELIYLCLGHGNSKRFLEEYPLADDVRIIDLSNDFRLYKDACFKGKNFVYGLPELNSETIKIASYIANPGCFATAIQMALLPLAYHNLLQDDVHVHALTGSTGAGKNFVETTSFNWRENNVSVYKSFAHQHLSEIKESLNSLQKDFDKDLNFVPMRGGFTRGIFASVYLKSEAEEAYVKQCFSDFYKDSKFVQISSKGISLKSVVNTNKCLLHIEKYGDKIHITSAIDNLLKGAAGQAILNMNLMFGFAEDEALKLKSTYY